MKQLIQRLSCPPSPSSSSRRRGSGKKAGHVPVYVVGAAGDEEERFVVRADLLAAPALVDLLARAAQEYGYDHQGPLRIPCSAAVFRRALALATAGSE